jgi:PilZ domain-containing protein
MDRLREFSIVTVSLPDSARLGEFKAYVVGVHRRTATLQPVEPGEAMWLPPTVDGVLMSFRHGAQTVGLKGELLHGDRPDDLRFRVTDGVYLPRRRSSRLKLCAPASVTVAGGEQIVCQTYDVGPDGVMLDGAIGLSPDQVISLSMMLPESPDAVCGQARVTEVLDGSLSSLEFVGLERDTQRRLSDFVSEHFRRRLEIVRSLRSKNDDRD